MTKVTDLPGIGERMIVLGGTAPNRIWEVGEVLVVHRGTKANKVRITLEFKNGKGTFNLSDLQNEDEYWEEWNEA